MSLNYNYHPSLLLSALSLTGGEFLPPDPSYGSSPPGTNYQRLFNCSANGTNVLTDCRIFPYFGPLCYNGEGDVILRCERPPGEYFMHYKKVFQQKEKCLTFKGKMIIAEREYSTIYMY